ncbi:MAG: hypothetical protein ACR2GL_06560 [Thermoleophilaceae bacterium]
MALPAGAAAEQASQPAAPAAAGLDVSGSGDTSGHSCALFPDDGVRCWGFGGDGRLGYASKTTIGDDETPGSAGPVDLGPGSPAVAIAAGAFHTCALLEDARVRCWGFGGDGRLGYGSTATVGDDETPGSVDPVDLGAGRTARAISTGGAHTCAVLDGGSVRCWGWAGDGRLGQGNRDQIGDDETPGSVDPVDLGAGRTARAISAGESHVCALLDDYSVRCWGLGANGQLGYRSTATIGDDETPGSVGPVDLGADRTARAISAGGAHTCALLDDGSVRCWGFATRGRLGYAAADDIGDDETPGSVGPVDLDPDSPAVAIAAGGRHTCARLEGGSVRCWGSGANGRLGYCNELDVGDDEAPSSVGPVSLAPIACPAARPPVPPSESEPPPPADPLHGALAAERRRARRLRTCSARVRRHARRERRRSRRGTPRRRARARSHLRRHRRIRLRACRKRYGRTPGRVTGLTARGVARRRIVLTFKAPGSSGRRPPAARRYVVKQSRRPLRGRRRLRRAGSLCRGTCRFPKVRRIGARITLTVTGLRPHTTYHYVVRARDNVSGRLGRRSRSVTARTR